MKNFVNIFVGFVLISLLITCNSSSDKTAKVNSDVNSIVKKSTPQETSENKKTVKMVDVPKLGGKSVKYFDEIFGEPVKVTEIKDNPRLMPGEFREYKVAGHPKNLSVRFYKDEAKRFNLLLGTPEKSSENALKEIFKIDVSEMSRVKSDSLSETWRGKSGGINYKTAYAKRSNPNGDFVMLHAEIE